MGNSITKNILEEIGENIVESKACRRCGNKFYITDKDIEFYKKVSPKFNGKVYEITAPNLCPECREKRRLAWRNERKLYRRRCDLCGETMISSFNSDKKYKIYCSDCWWSDKWNPIEYGQEFDFNKSFFEQFNELINKTPLLGLIIIDSVNSDYTNIVAYNKNCYFIVESSNNEDSYYSYWIQLSKNIVDSVYITNSKVCYESSNINNGYNLFYCSNCIDCSNSYYLKNSIGCNYCFSCANLQNKSYYIFNKQVKKEYYLKFIEEFKIYLDKRRKYIKQAKKFLLKQPIKNLIINFSENCIGNYIQNSKDSIFVFEANISEKCKYSVDVWRNAYDIMDGNTNGINAKLIYNTTNVAIDVSNICFSAMCWTGINKLYYSYFCANNSKNLFGCVGLKGKEYCILNKQYTKEEYEELVPKIIEHMKKTGEWGEFFPSSISPFGYNETVAQEYFPLEKEEALKQGFNWSDYEAPTPQVKKVIPAEKLPEDISEIPDDILNWAIRCETSGKLFRIVSQELEFYRKYNLPIPRKHPDVRHLERMKLRNPRKLYERKCDKCGKKIITTYNSEREEIVYCEKCYEKEIY